MSLTIITELSNFYGSDSAFVLAGGGNTSVKDEENLYIKPSGVRLADITEEKFVKINRAKVKELFTFNAPENRDEREAVVKTMMADAVAPGASGRPSVETPLHEIIPFKYVVHLHPGLVNGMTCGQQGKEKCAELFPEALWCDYIDPGFTLAKYIYDEIGKYIEKNGKHPKVIIQKNHGVFVGADTKEEINDIYSNIMNTLEDYYSQQGISTTLKTTDCDTETTAKFAPSLRSLLSSDSERMSVTSSPAYKVSGGALTPDHIVYAKSYVLINDNPDESAIANFAETHGYKPLVLSIPGKCTLAAGKTYKDAATVALLAKDAAFVQQLTEAFGGPSYLTDSSIPPPTLSNSFVIFSTDSSSETLTANGNAL